MSFNRGRKTLLDSIKELKVILLECAKHGFKPEAETVKAKLESLVNPEELPVYRLYLKNEQGDDTGYDKAMRAMESLAKDQADVVCQSNDTGGTPPFAGGAFRSKRGVRRKGYPEREEGDSKKCKRCGKGCPLARGGDRKKCYAYDKKCKKCGKLGHFEAVCKSKAVGVAATAVEKAKSKAEALGTPSN